MSKVTRLFDEICAKYPKRTAFIFFHDGKIQQRTFHDLENDVLIATETLTRYGVRPGDRILAFAKSSYQLCVYMLATFKLGASILYVDIWAQQEGLKRAFDNFQPTFILISNSTKLVRLLFPEINKINQIINVDNHVDDPNILQIYPEPKDDTIALMTMTTGSTGKPKIAIRTHESLYQQLRLVKQNQKDRGQPEIVLTTSYIYIFANIVKGYTTVLPTLNLASNNKKRLNAQLAHFRKFPITMIYTTPDFCLKTKDMYPYLHTLYIGGAILNLNEAEIIRNTFPRCNICYIYGATECNLIAATNLNDYIKHLCLDEDTILGKPVKGVKVKTNHNSEIYVSSPALLENYLDKFKDNKVRDDDGTLWHHTGDTGAIIDGKLYYYGRTKAVVHLDNKRYFSNQIEQKTIRRFRNIDKCAVLELDKTLYVFYESKRPPSPLQFKYYMRELKVPKYHIKRVRKIPCDVKHHTKINYNILLEKIKK